MKTGHSRVTAGGRAGALLCLVLFACASYVGVATAEASSMDWQELGPAPTSGADLYTGRISAIACSPTDPDCYFAGGADGGVWRTVDGDLDGDLSDVATLLSGYGCTGGFCTGDIDGDGNTDADDLLILLVDYGYTQ